MTGAGLAFARVEGATVELCLGPGELVYSVDWVFPFVSSARWTAEQGRVLVTATPVARRAPSVRADDRGDLALLAWKPGEDAWQLLYRGYAHDAVCLSGGGFAVHRGGGLTFLDPSGRKVREVKAGRFNWGPPSLSVRPAGDLVAWIRWRGDGGRPGSACHPCGSGRTDRIVHRLAGRQRRIGGRALRRHPHHPP